MLVTARDRRFQDGVLALARIDRVGRVGKRGESERRAFAGELAFQLLPHGEQDRLDRVDLGLFTTDAVEKESIPGPLSAVGFEFQESLESRGQDSWRVELDFKARFVSRELEREFGFTVRKDLHLPRFELFQGRLFGELEERFGTLRFSTGQIRLDSPKERMGSVEWIELDLEGQELELHPLMARDCEESRKALQKRLKLKPVRFRTEAGGTTGGSWDYQFGRACEVWKKACIELVDLGFKNCGPIPNGDLEEIARAHSEPGAVEIFLVGDQLQGGETVGIDAGVSIVLTDNYGGDEYLLAHELGHVLGGEHPGDSEPFRWTGETDTVLEPGDPFSPSCNSLGNCQNAQKARHNLVATQGPCCLQPDEGCGD